jgi:NTE family protein
VLRAGAKTTSRRARLGLALGSGGARGWAHVGVLRALTAAEVVPDVVVGTSIGALIAGVHLAGHLPTLEAWARNLTRPRLLAYLDPRMSGGGLIGGRRMLAFMDRHLGALKIEDLPLPFVAVATDLRTGHEVWLQEGRLAEVLRTAISLPGLFTPMRRERQWLVDGALVNPVPVSAARALGARVVIAVNLNSDLFGRGTTIASHGTDAPDERWLEQMSHGLDASAGAARIVKRQMLGSAGRPGITTVMIEAFNIMQDRITRARLAGDPPDVMVNPRLGPIGLFEFHRASESIALGAEAAERALDSIEQALTALA